MVVALAHRDSIMESQVTVSEPSHPFHERSAMRTPWSVRLLLLCSLFLFTGKGRGEPDVFDTRLLSQPTISAQHVAFIYADDLWIADLDGKNVRRLTTDIGVESHPVFSPDGRTIAFSAQYDGNTDVYTMPITGGAP